MKQIVTGQVVKQGRAAYASSAWPAMRQLIDLVIGQDANLVDSDRCLEILAADISDERVDGGARPFTYAGSSIDYWENCYLRLVADGFDELLSKGKGADPVQMCGLRNATLRKLFPFENVSKFKTTGEAGMQDTSSAAMLSFQMDKTSALDGYENDMTHSERLYNGK